MQHCYVSFRISSQQQLERLSRVVSELRHDKESGEFRSDEDWKAYFTADELKSFWTPTDAERADWQKRWQATPVPDRFTDPSLETPWDFGSMLDSIREGEYSLLGVRSNDMTTGFLEFDPEAYPFGGTGCLRALVIAYGHQLIGYDDGTGFIETESTDA